MPFRRIASRHGRPILVAGLCLLLSAAFGIVRYWNTPVCPAPEMRTKLEQLLAGLKIESAGLSVAPPQLSLLLLGDTSFGESYFAAPGSRQKNLLRHKGYRYPLKNFRNLLRAADYTIANLETPLTSLLVSPQAGQKNLIHWERPEPAVPIYQEIGIRAFGLANNHTLDFGPAGLRETLATLDHYGVAHFGAGTDINAAAEPLRLDLPLGDDLVKIALIAGFAYRLNYDFRYNFYASATTAGVLPLTSTTICQKIRELKAREPDRLVIVYPHWGENYIFRSRAQRQLARAFLEAGADLIIGHGAHMLQEVEWIGSTPVIYSLGNFMFNSPGRYNKLAAPPYSLIARLILTPAATKPGHPEGRLRLYPLLCDNTRTSYQNRLVNEAEFREVITTLLCHSQQPEVLLAKFRVGRDEFGFYLEMGAGWAWSSK